MNLHHEALSSPVAAAPGRRCPTCAGAVAHGASRKHRRVRCTVCGTDVPPAVPPGRIAASGASGDSADPDRAVRRKRPLRPSPARGIVRDKAALVG